MSLLVFVIAGLISGFVAELLFRGAFSPLKLVSEELGYVSTVAIGLAGALISGYLFILLGVEDNPVGWILTSLLGAVVLLAIFNLISSGLRGFEPRPR